MNMKIEKHTKKLLYLEFNTGVYILFSYHKGHINKTLLIKNTK